MQGKYVDRKVLEEVVKKVVEQSASSFVSPDSVSVSCYVLGKQGKPVCRLIWRLMNGWMGCMGCM